MTLLSLLANKSVDAPVDGICVTLGVAPVLLRHDALLADASLGGVLHLAAKAGDRVVTVCVSH